MVIVQVLSNVIVSWDRVCPFDISERDTLEASCRLFGDQHEGTERNAGKAENYGVVVSRLYLKASTEAPNVCQGRQRLAQTYGLSCLPPPHTWRYRASRMWVLPLCTSSFLGLVL